MEIVIFPCGGPPAGGGGGGGGKVDALHLCAIGGLLDSVPHCRTSTHSRYCSLLMHAVHAVQFHDSVQVVCGGKASHTSVVFGLLASLPHACKSTHDRIRSPFVHTDHSVQSQFSTHIGSSICGTKSV